MITKLKPNQIFVYGSNCQGLHAGGAAKQAYEQFGAQWGIGHGLVGQTYAIDTMSGEQALLVYCNQFIDFAQHYPEYEFLLTPVGTGIACYSLERIERIFSVVPSNVIKLWEQP